MRRQILPGAAGVCLFRGSAFAQFVETGLFDRTLLWLLVDVAQIGLLRI
jgi:hypothetical protein